MSFHKVTVGTFAALLVTLSLAHFEPDGSVPSPGSLTAVGDPATNTNEPVLPPQAAAVAAAAEEVAPGNPAAATGNGAPTPDGLRGDVPVVQGSDDKKAQVSDEQAPGAGPAGGASSTTGSESSDSTVEGPKDGQGTEPVSTPAPGAADPAVGPTVADNDDSVASKGPAPEQTTEGEETPEETADGAIEATPEETPQDSVEAEESAEDEDGGSVCFPAGATVELEDGSTRRMDELAVGDVVRTGVSSFSRVFMFTHRDAYVRNAFLTLTTSSGAAITLTSSHYIYADGLLVAAGNVAQGAELTLASGERDVVVAISPTRRTGLYNPQTVDGDVVVDGVLASTYTTAVEPGFAHALLAPFRAVYTAVGLYTSAFDAGSQALASVAPNGRPLVV